MGQLFEFAMNHPMLVGATLMALIAALGWELRLRGQRGVSVPAGEAVRLINQGATVVDLREAAKFAAGHIVDAINVTASDLKSQPESRIKKKKPVLLVCENGSASARLVAPLREAGFEVAWSLDGGLAAWERENLPVVANRSKS